MKMQRKWVRRLVRAATRHARNQTRVQRSKPLFAALATGLGGIGLVAGHGPGWIVKSRNLKFEDVFAELWSWVQEQWMQVLPIVVVAVVLGIIVALIKTAHGRQEGQGSIGKLVLAGIAALFMTGLVG